MGLNMTKATHYYYHYYYYYSGLLQSHVKGLKHKASLRSFHHEDELEASFWQLTSKTGPAQTRKLSRTEAWAPDDRGLQVPVTPQSSGAGPSLDPKHLGLP